MQGCRLSINLCINSTDRERDSDRASERQESARDGERGRQEQNQGATNYMCSAGGLNLLAEGFTIHNGERCCNCVHHSHVVPTLPVLHACSGDDLPSTP